MSLSFSVSDDCLLDAAASPARWGPSRTPCRTAAAMLRRSKVLPYPAAPASAPAPTLGVPRRRPVLVVFGFPLSERAALLRMLHRDYDVAPATVAPAPRPCAYVVVRPATQQIALTLRTLHGTHHRAADGCEYYLGVLERPDLDATFVGTVPPAADGTVAVPSATQPGTWWARWTRWLRGGGAAGAPTGAGTGAYRRVEQQSVAHVFDSFVRALSEIFGTNKA